MVTRENVILRAPSARRGQVERKDGRLLRRFTIYLDQDLARRLALHCAATDRGLSECIASVLEGALATAEPVAEGWSNGEAAFVTEGRGAGHRGRGDKRR
jgi:hypothetical protein